MRLLPAILALATTLNAADWPRFRGLNGAGVDSASTALPTRMDPAKDALWKTPVPFGRSSPVISGNRIFLTAATDTQLLVLAYDTRTGKQLWRRELPNVHKQKIYRANDPANASTTADASAVYAFFADFGLIAFTHDGKELWRHPLGPFANFYGMGASPIVEGDFVIILCDDEKTPYLLALDRKSGRQRWKINRTGAVMSWSTPIIFRPAQGEPQILVMGTRSIDAYYLSTGERRWWTPFACEGAIGTPVLNGDSLLVFGLGHEEPVVAPFPSVLPTLDKDKDGRISQEEFKADKDWFEHFGWIDNNKDNFIDAAEWKRLTEYMNVKDYGIFSINPANNTGKLPASSISWRFQRNLPYVPSPVLYNGAYFMVKDGGIVTSLNPATGALIKQGRATGALGAYFASPVAGNGKLYLLSEEGKLTVIKADPQWEVLQVNDMGEEAYATPALAGNRIYVRTRSTLLAFGEK